MKYLFLIWLMLAFCFSFAQENVFQKYSLDDIIETILEGSDEEVDVTTVLEDLENFYENPLNINTASQEDLQKLYVLSDFQVSRIIAYRNEWGPILSVYELNSLEGFDQVTLEKILPFISFDLPSSVAEEKISLKNSRQQIMLRSQRTLQKQKGYKQEDGGIPAYEGSPLKIYSRYRIQVGNKAQAGFTAEKDAGEAFFKGSNKYGFDYYSAHLSINFSSFLRNITVGDFRVQSGQGLVLWQGFAQRKPDDPTQLLKNPGGIRAYTSTDENQFFRGIGTSLQWKNWEWQLFTSLKKRDANFEENEEGSYFTSFQTSGYHRTGNEISDEKSITETAAGSVITFQRNRFKGGATFLYQHFNVPFFRDNKPYNLYRFSGDKNLNAGLHYYYVLGKYQFFGEAAVSKSGGTAFIQGLLAHFHDQLTFSLLFRNYKRNYQALYGNGFGESSGTSNETGLYAGIKLLPFKKARLTAYTDYYRFPWIKYTASAPSQGHDMTLRVDYLFSRKLQFYIRLKSENKEEKIVEGEKYINTAVRTDKVRLHIDWSVSDYWKLRTRAEYSRYRKQEPEHGFMVYQDVVFISVKNTFSAQGRIAYTRTDSYNTRIYAYENDLLYNYSMPAYYGKSMRTYLNIKYKIMQNWELWFKLGNTFYPASESIGSGLNEVAGQMLTEVKIQTRLKF